MMPEGNLVTAEFLREIEHLFASHPRAEETGLLLTADISRGLDGLCAYFKSRRLHVKGNAQRITKGLQIAGVALVMDVLHPHVQGLYRESWVQDLGALC